MLSLIKSEMVFRLNFGWNLINLTLKQNVVVEANLLQHVLFILSIYVVLSHVDTLHQPPGGWSERSMSNIPLRTLMAHCRLASFLLEAEPLYSVTNPAKSKVFCHVLRALTSKRYTEAFHLYQIMSSLESVWISMIHLDVWFYIKNSS